MEIGSEREIVSIIQKHSKNHTELISVLEEIQNTYGYLPGEALKIIAEHTEHTLVDIYGVATFYKAFSLKPRGKHLVLVCMGTACHVRGAPRIVEEFEQQLGVGSGSTTDDKEFTLETVNCLGACALGPTVVVDGHYFSHVSRNKVKTIISRTRQGLDTVNIGGDPRIFPVSVSCPMCGKSLMIIEPGIGLIDTKKASHRNVSSKRYKFITFQKFTMAWFGDNFAILHQNDAAADRRDRIPFHLPPLIRGIIGLAM